MFEKDLVAKFERIFEVRKVTFDQPALEAAEQETLFIEVESSRNSIADGRARAMVRGSAFMIGQSDKLSFGFFSKKIHKAAHADTRDIVFFDIESSSKRFRNLVQRGFGFIYFFNTQFDPEQGSITAIELGSNS